MKYRHGDVLIKKVESIKGVKLNHLVLAEGEVTGHKHVVTLGKACLYDDNGTLYLRVITNEATVTHEEHKPLTLPQGDYGIEIQREYEPGGWRRVVD